MGRTRDRRGETALRSCAGAYCSCVHTRAVREVRGTSGVSSALEAGATAWDSIYVLVEPEVTVF